MSRKTTHFKRILGFVLAFVMALTSVGIGSGITASAFVESVNGSDSLVRTSLSEIRSILTSMSYSDYLKEHAGTPNAKAPIEIDFDKIDTAETNATVGKAQAKDFVNGAEALKDGEVFLMGDDGKVGFKVSIPEDAFYAIEIEYWTGNAVVFGEDGKIVSQGKNTDIERIVLIDGKVPFKESRSITLTRSWCDVYNKINADYKCVFDSDGNKMTYDSTSESFITSVSKQEENVRIFQRDNSGNEMKPNKEIYPLWTTYKLRDSSGYYAEPLTYFFEAGEHVISFSTIREPLAVRSIRLVPAEDTITYSEYLKKHDAEGAKDYTGDATVKIQGEYTTLTSDKTIYQLNDRTSAISEPQDAALQRLNSIGGDKWKYVGQWIEYQIEAPEAGYYNIALRYKQSIMEGMYVSRKIYINGELPFKEAGNCRFNYDSSWQMGGFYDGKYEIPNSGSSFKFFLNKGVNKIRIEVVLGDMAEILSSVETTLTNANAFYRKILMLTGPDPDEYRDYGFDKLMPEVLKGLKQSAAELYDISNKLTEVTGIVGSNNGTLERVAIILERMGKYPDKIAATLSTMKDYLAALGSWLTSTQSQPLEIDYIIVQSVSKGLPEAEAGFWTRLTDEIQKFFVSFFADYNSISSTTDISEEEMKALENASIEVWTATSRDQAQIIKRLVDDDFMEKYNIPVNVKLVIGGTLLPATLAGTGPDVAMNIDQATPVNYAIRSAIYSLNSDLHGYNFNDFSKFASNPAYKSLIENGSIDTFNEVFERFVPAAKTPVTLYGETYALPETMSFPMMFYRKDIFVEKGLEVPNTWDNFKECISALQASNLNIGFPQGTGGSMILMYQQDETLYDMGNYDYYLENFPEVFGYDEAKNEYTKNVYYDDEGNVFPKTDGMTINLDSNTSLSAFKKVCQYFTMYDFPVSYQLADRFRDGTMPLAVSDYASTYNTLIVFAPEIAGLWEFTPLPGTVLEDGKTIDNTTVASISTMMLMRSVTDDNALSAWIFMQWWTSAEIQSSYANEMEALLGPSAKQATANVEALSQMSWSKDEMDNLMAQFNAVECTPEFPGSYIIGRYTSFAFLDVYNNKADPVTELLSYIVDINNELTRKRNEFGIPTAENFRKTDSGVTE